jgi:hypothetical protein
VLDVLLSQCEYLDSNRLLNHLRNLFSRHSRTNLADWIGDGRINARRNISVQRRSITDLKLANYRIAQQWPIVARSRRIADDRVVWNIRRFVT